MQTVVVNKRDITCFMLFQIKTLKLLEEDFSSHRQTELDQTEYRQGYPVSKEFVKNDTT